MGEAIYRGIPGKNRCNRQNKKMKMNYDLQLLVCLCLEKSTVLYAISQNTS